MTVIHVDFTGKLETQTLNMSSLYLTLSQKKYWRLLSKSQKKIVQTVGRMLEEGTDSDYPNFLYYKIMDKRWKQINGSR